MKARSSLRRVHTYQAILRAKKQWARNDFSERFQQNLALLDGLMAKIDANRTDQRKRKKADS